MIELEYKHVPEVYLWRAVIQQAIFDATLNPRKLHGMKNKAEAESRMKERRRIQAEARNWLLDNGRDFRTVCALALLDPDAVRDKARALAGRKWPSLGMNRPQPTVRRGHGAHPNH